MTVDDIDDLKQPGVLFQFDEYEFITQGMAGGGLDVVRLNSGHADTLDVDIVEEHIEQGDLEFIDTHTESEIAVNEETLVDVLAFTADDPALDAVEPDSGGVGTSLLKIERELPADAYNFRFRDE